MKMFNSRTFYKKKRERKKNFVRRYEWDSSDRSFHTQTPDKTPRVPENKKENIPILF